MTTQRRMTRPGPTDNEFMTVTCTPDTTAIEFFEFQPEAEEAARVNLHPTTTSYVAKVIKQGEHRVKGSSKYIAVMVEVDPELAAAIKRHSRASGRQALVNLFTSLLGADLEQIRSEYQAATRGNTDDEKTHPGIVPPGQCGRCGGVEGPTCCADMLARREAPR